MRSLLTYHDTVLVPISFGKEKSTMFRDFGEF
jgi:hypothetical protein